MGMWNGAATHHPDKPHNTHLSCFKCLIIVIIIPFNVQINIPVYIIYITSHVYVH